MTDLVTTYRRTNRRQGDRTRVALVKGHDSFTCLLNVQLKKPNSSTPAGLEPTTLWREDRRLTMCVDNLKYMCKKHTHVFLSIQMLPDFIVHLIYFLRPPPEGAIETIKGIVKQFIHDWVYHNKPSEFGCSHTSKVKMYIWLKALHVSTK